MQVIEKLEELNRRYEELDSELSRPEVVSDLALLKKFSKEQSELTNIIKAYRHLSDILHEIAEVEGIIADAEDPELVGMAREDLAASERKEGRSGAGNQTPSSATRSE